MNRSLIALFLGAAATCAQSELAMPKEALAAAEAACRDKFGERRTDCEQAYLTAHVSDFPSASEQKAADAIVAKCGRLGGKAREQCVSDMLDFVAPADLHRINYLSDQRMRLADRTRLDAACKRAGFQKDQAQIGMTAQQVRDCGWGEPSDVNRTTTRYGVHEQWVYGNGGYLYFDDGRLTAIQN